MKNLKIEDKIFIFIFGLILLGGFLKPLLRPATINLIENRTAYKMPTFLMPTFIDKSYQDNMEKAFSDQIPLANKMKIFIKTGIVSSKKFFYEMLDKNNYYDLSNDVYLYNDVLVYEKISSNLEKNMDIRADNINKYIKNMPNINFNIYYIERDLDIDFRNNLKTLGAEYLFENLDSNANVKKFRINDFSEFKHYFYETDHHWNHFGSYKAYQEIVSMLTNEESIPYQGQKCFKNAMSGSKAIAIGGTEVFRETFCGYQFDLKKHDIYVNNQLVNSYGNYADIMQNGSSNISYGEFYGNDFGLIEFDYHQSEKENLLIIGESYDNAINELLASHFNKTYNIDLRYYEDSLNQEFNLFKFAEENDIKQILLIGNTSFFIDDTFKLKGGK